MPDDNLAKVRAVYAGWARGEFSTSLALFHENVTLVVDPAIPDGGTYTGAEGVREYMSAFLEPWELLSITGTSFKEVGHKVLVEVTQTGTGRSGGVPVEMRYFQLWTFRGDLVERLEVIMSEQSAIQAAGLTE